MRDQRDTPLVSRPAPPRPASQRNKPSSSTAPSSKLPATSPPLCLTATPPPCLLREATSTGLAAVAPQISHPRPAARLTAGQAGGWLHAHRAHFPRQRVAACTRRSLSTAALGRALGRARSELGRIQGKAMRKRAEAGAFIEGPSSLKLRAFLRQLRARSVESSFSSFYRVFPRPENFHSLPVDGCSSVEQRRRTTPRMS